MDSLLPVVIIAVLILLNGLFVAAEFAIIGAPRSSIERAAKQGNRAARTVRAILHDPVRQDRYIATAQLGITFASLGLGMYGEHVLAEWLAHWLEGLGTSRWIAAHALASVLAIGILTYFHIVVGEMVPKSLALQHAERTVLRITPLMMALKTVFLPLVILLNGIGNGILRLMGIRREMTAGHYHTPEELNYIVRESQEGGLLRAEAGHVLRELFEFGELTAGEVMVPRVRIVGIPLNATAERLAQIVRAERHTRYPVFASDLDHILGMVHIKDVLRLLLQGLALSEDAVRPVAHLPETSELDTVLTTMRRERTQMIIVMDEHGGTAGLVTIEDLFEELVGEIEEGAATLPSIYVDDQGHTRAAGTARLEQVGEALGIPLEDEDVDTVSGLVLMLLERLPQVGDTVEQGGIRFEVTAVAGHGVAECLVSKAPPPADPEV